VKCPAGYAPATLLVLRLPAGHTPSEAFVLAEWKIVRDTSEREQKANDALKQA
jgi:hypothetical protein